MGQSDTTTYTATPESPKRKNNSYKVNPALLFQWRGKGINIDHAVFKPTLEFAIGLQINTDMELRRIAAYLYRVLLEIASVSYTHLDVYKRQIQLPPKQYRRIDICKVLFHGLEESVRYAKKF